MTTNLNQPQQLDPFYGTRKPFTTPLNAAAVTPSDEAPLPFVARRIWVGAAGNISLIMQGDLQPVTLSNVPAGIFLDLAVKQINSTGTTASSLIAFV